MPQRAEQPSIPIIADDDFRQLINQRIEELLCLARFVQLYGGGEECFTRPLLGDLLSESTKIEELLDAYGVRNNRRWLPLRQLIAGIKLFSNVAYILLHIEHALPSYNLVDVDKDFIQATRQTFLYTSAVVARILTTLLERAEALDIHCPTEAPSRISYTEQLPPGMLPDDRVKRTVTSAEETAVYLATAFLNLAGESKVLHTCMRAQKRDYAKFFPDPLSEETLRDLEEKFHNLQAVYDTYISDTNVETLDEDLPVLRGHISVIFHLLETATAFTHYYERHLRVVAKQAKVPKGLIDTRTLLHVLVSYSLVFTSLYLNATRTLCHKMLKRYAKLGKVMVNVPKYRGFHVRPSTLIAKIVNHYGSEVCMKMDGDQYNAAVTLDLFRANEKLNARKRKRLIAEIHRLPLDGTQKAEIRQALHQALQLLLTHKKLVLYKRSLPLDELQPEAEESVYDFAARAVTRFLALGLIDAELNSRVSFSGDLRVLADIKLLAESGYGEDNFGNNMDLPPELTYLRR